jgi:anthranilate phosphoribosyltransferase
VSSAATALVVHARTGSTDHHPHHAALLDAGAVSALSIDPEAFGIERVALAALAGGDAVENARIARAILAGEPGPKRDIVVLNAGAALFVAEAAADLRAGLELARKSIDSGAAAGRLERLVRATAAVCGRG